MSVDFGKLLREQQARQEAAATMTECMTVWHTPSWDYEMLCTYQREHVCILGLGHVGNHRDASGNVRVRFED